MFVCRSCFSWVLPALIFVPDVAEAEVRPIPVSPGAIDAASAVESRCPTFQWGAVEGARGYQVAVYRLGETASDVEPVLEQELPAGATGWTPSLERCLARGDRYAWAVRALGDETKWSEAHLFEVPEGPSAAEIAEAVEVLRRAREPERSHAPGPPADVPAVVRPARSERGRSTENTLQRKDSPGASNVRATIRAIAVGDDFPTSTEVGVYAATGGDDSLDAGLFGEATNSTGIGAGVIGVAASPRAVGVHGDNEAFGADPSPINFPHGIGVMGESSHPDGIGVYANAFQSEGTGVYVRAGGTGVEVDQSGGEDLLRLDASTSGTTPDLIEATADDFTVFRVDFDGNLTAISLSADSLSVNTLNIDALAIEIREVTSGGTVSQAICQTDELLTGGGCECAGGGSVVSSGPDGTDAWRCQCPAGNFATVWAVCLKGNPPTE